MENRWLEYTRKTIILARIRIYESISELIQQKISFLENYENRYNSMNHTFKGVEERCIHVVFHTGDEESFIQFKREGLICFSIPKPIFNLVNTSVHQNPSEDNPFAAKNQNLHF